jgi:hypothetical protein
MAFNHLAMPEYKVSNPWDTTPIYNALDQNQRLGQQQRQFDATNKLQQAQFGLAQNQDRRQQAQFDTQQQLATVQKFAGHAQNIMQMTDPTQRTQAWHRLIASHPKSSDLPLEYWDPQRGPQMLIQEAQGYLGPKDQADIDYKRAMAAKAQREAVQGPETFGKAGTIVQGPDGAFYTVQFGARGERKIEPLQIGGAGTAGQRLTPSRGVMQVGDELADKATGQTVRRVGGAIEGEAGAKVRGKETAELQFSMPKAQAALESANAKAGIVREKIKQAIPMVSNWTTGYGAVLANWPATAARDFKGITDTIIANLGFDELQEMRANSPTGGALGQVAVQELEMLQRAKGSLEQAQSPQQVLRVLQELDQFYAQAGPRRQRAFERTYAPVLSQGGGAPQGGQDMPRPSSPEEAARLPRGTRFIAPDGSIRTVP